ncbi:unnamed protein product [Fusarium venenatum]|uniref:Uncharacterized protein n=1 Tax=Fusarium venenatum TaxID=56646 RepID=A0A2L2TJP4_9HYPO|nr:uncharacterized protein FVRRES_13268 [Fusarium venenatum]CEI40772.1 unnamed protein product [Fusarium venenatum]
MSNESEKLVRKLVVGRRRSNTIMDDPHLPRGHRQAYLPYLHTMEVRCYQRRILVRHFFDENIFLFSPHHNHFCTSTNFCHQFKLASSNFKPTLSTTMSGRNNNWRGASRGGGFGRGGNPPRGSRNSTPYSRPSRASSSSSQQQQQQPQQTAPEAKKNKPVVTMINLSPHYPRRNIISTDYAYHRSAARRWIKEALDKADRAYDRAMVHQAEAIRQNQLRDAELNTVLHWRAEAEKREDALEVLATMDARLEELAAARAGAPKAKEKEKETVEIEEE